VRHLGCNLFRRHQGAGRAARHLPPMLSLSQLLSQIIVIRDGTVIGRICNVDKVAAAQAAGADHVIVDADENFAEEARPCQRASSSVSRLHGPHPIPELLRTRTEQFLTEYVRARFGFRRPPNILSPRRRRRTTRWRAVPPKGSFCSTLDLEECRARHRSASIRSVSERSGCLPVGSGGR
jgi:hypothetical protein